MGLERRLEMLDETQQIKEVMAKYFKVIDGKDVMAVMSLFNGDATLIFGKAIFRGFEVVQKFWLSTFRKHLGMRHTVSNIVVKPQGEEAEATCSRMFPGDGKSITMWGCDEFTFKKEGELGRSLKNSSRLSFITF